MSPPLADGFFGGAGGGFGFVADCLALGEYPACPRPSINFCERFDIFLPMIIFTFFRFDEIHKFNILVEKVESGKMDRKDLGLPSYKFGRKCYESLKDSWNKPFSASKKEASIDNDAR